jgi:hypothetical protein
MCADSPAPYARGPRGIDHLVIAARDLDALARDYRRLGFTVGARNRHPWGTENHIIQFAGCFLELIAIGEGATIQPAARRSYSFGGFLNDYLAKREGLAMLVLESKDAAADAAAFDAAGIGGFDPFFFERASRRPDGSEARVAFTLGFAAMKQAANAGFFVCQQHEPQNFWNPAFQRHENGVAGVERVTLVATDPSDCHEFLGAFIGQRAMRATSLGLEIETGRGVVEVLSPEGFRFRYGAEPPDAAEGPVLAGVTLTCERAEAMAPRLEALGLGRRAVAPGVVSAERPLHGAMLAFSAGGKRA